MNQDQEIVVLVVDDDMLVLEMVVLMLERVSGYCVLSASTPHEALQKAMDHAGNLDLLITDVRMPDVDGKELAQQLRLFVPGLKIIFMSGYLGTSTINDIAPEKECFFLKKPFLKKNLLNTIKKAMDKEPGEGS